MAEQKGAAWRAQSRYSAETPRRSHQGVSSWRASLAGSVLPREVLVDVWDRIRDLGSRLASYPKLEIAFELAVIALFVWLVIRFVQGTRAAGALKGILIVFFVLTLPVLGRAIFGGESLLRLWYLYERFLAVFALALVVIFQPELRRAAIRVGEASGRLFSSTPSQIVQVVDAITEACAYLSKARFGALIVIERTVGLDGLVEGGTTLGAEVSPRLLQTIFFPGTALHDLAVVIRGRVIRSASVQLPMAEPEEMPDRALGARHRAAVGLTRECDALVVVVSEETGQIRLAERGALSLPMSATELRAELLRRLREEPPRGGQTAADVQEESEAMLPAAAAEVAETPAGDRSGAAQAARDGS